MKTQLKSVEMFKKSKRTDNASDYNIYYVKIYSYTNVR